MSREAASKTVNKLQEVRTDSGKVVLISGSFWVSDLDINQFEFTYKHPVSKHIKRNVEIYFCLEKQHWKQGSNKLSYLNIYSKVLSQVDLDSSRWELEIKPIAVYS